MAKTLAVFNKINSLRERYYEASIGKEALIKLVSEAEIAEQVYNSNAIENSTLTLEETEKILLQIDLDRFISQREIFEAQNLARVVSYIDKRSREKELTLDVMKRLTLEHFAAIDQSDLLYVLCPEGYVGRSVTLEIGYAYAKGKRVFFSEPTKVLEALNLIACLKEG